jgi:hypothetical protein
MQDATAIIDGIKRSVETVGWSGRDGISLDNVSFRIDAREIDVPHDSEIVEAMVTADELAKDLLEDGALGYNYEGVFLVYYNELLPNCVSLQVILGEHRKRLDMIATLHRTDVINELPRDVLVCELLMEKFALAANRESGFLTVNVGVATVMWDDAELFEEPDEIEIPM